MTDILAGYPTEELKELLQFIETKDGRFKKLKRQIKQQLALRTLEDLK